MGITLRLTRIITEMVVVGIKKLDEFKRRYAHVCSSVDSWLAEAKEASWRTPQDVKQRYASASFLKDNHVVFNLKGNQYRLKVKIDYPGQLLLIVGIGTHQEYMNW